MDVGRFDLERVVSDGLFGGDGRSANQLITHGRSKSLLNAVVSRPHPVN